MNYKLYVVIVVSLIMFTACNEIDNPTGESVVYMLPNTTPMRLEPGHADLVNKNNEFAFNLFRTINDLSLKKESMGVSPLSVSIMLGMLNDGAGGDTSKEITSVLGYAGADAKTINEFFKTLIEGLPLVDTSISLDIANFIAANKDVIFESQFEKDMKEYYSAGIASLDFALPNALKTINDWCSEKTDGKIDKVLDSLDPLSALVLMNAVNFKAGWTNKFDTKETEEGEFKLESGDTKKLQMMHQKGRIRYEDSENYSCIYLPYGGIGLSWGMTILLPHEGKTVEDVLKVLNVESWKSLPSSFKDVDIKIPRFTTASQTDLIPPIVSLGAPLMFSEKADFSKMSSNYKDLYVNKMLQKSAIEVSEEGTKLVAVTVSLVDPTDAPDREQEIINFHCDRPFVYVIQEASSGAIFFIGTFRGE